MTIKLTAERTITLGNPPVPRLRMTMHWSARHISIEPQNPEGLDAINRCIDAVADVYAGFAGCRFMRRPRATDPQLPPDALTIDRISQRLYGAFDEVVEIELQEQ